jgi:hypothetical protein
MTLIRSPCKGCTLIQATGKGNNQRAAIVEWCRGGEGVDTLSTNAQRFMLKKCSCRGVYPQGEIIREVGGKSGEKIVKSFLIGE